MKLTPAIALLTLAVRSPALAGFTVFEQNYTGWKNAAGVLSTITFAEVPADTYITDQYASLGVLFTSSDPDATYPYGPTTFLQDGWGLDGDLQVELTFSQPINAIGWHFPGDKAVKFYSGSTLVWSDVHIGQSGQLDNFTGFIGDVTFDRVQMTGIEPNNSYVAIDNIYFSTIPGPAGLALGAVAFACGRGRRRR